jgi:putative serine protease PepD
VSGDRSRGGGRLWTEPREADEQQRWLEETTRIVPRRPLTPPGPTPEERAAAEAEARRQARRRRLSMVAAVAAVMVLALVGEAVLDGTGDTKTSALPDAVPGAAPADARSRTVRAVYASASPSVANIQVSTARGQATGTGFLVDTDGTFVTNSHVVEGADKARVRLEDGGRAVEGDVVGRDASSDLAVIKVDPSDADGIKPLALAESDDVQVGDLAVAIGFPLNLDKTATSGIISGLGRELKAPNGFSIDKVIQTDAPINPGNSGGPLLDSRGRVIGVNSQIATAGGGGSVGIGFAVPSDTVRRIVPRLKGGGVIKRAYLGVSTAPSPAGAGAIVASVVPSGPADAAGLQTGDVVTSVDGKSVREPNDVSDAVAGHDPGETIRLEVERGGAQATLSVRLGTRPERTP